MWSGSTTRESSGRGAESGSRLRPLGGPSEPRVEALCWLQTGTTSVTLFRLIYVAVLVLILVTDVEHRLILHAVSLPGIAIAIAGAYLTPAFDTPKRALVGGAMGLVAALFLYFLGQGLGVLIGRMRGEPLPGPAFGFGDVTLSTFLGVILGAPEIIFALVFGIVAGFLGAIVYLVSRRVLGIRHVAFTAFLPYGPFLILGGAFMFFYGSAFMAWYTAS